MGRGITVLNQVRLAIKELREHTRGTYIVYDMKSPYIRQVQDNVYWVNKIQESVTEDKIVAFYQPIVNNKTKKIEKYECLARIDDDGDFVSPYHFMDAAKETRVLSLITKSMIKKSM
ncbi:MAG: EAL domain-containing protein [Sulfurimonas sp.]|nr:EAL domain-containing protein [Sulfurimonas sp.]